MAHSNEFSHIPALASELKAWATMYPNLTDIINGDCDYREVVAYVSRFKTVLDPKNKESEIEYGFSDEDIKYIIDHAREGDFKQEEITKIVQDTRERESKESRYINNIVRMWEDYEVPNADTNDMYKIGIGGIFKYTKVTNETTGKTDYIKKDVCRTPFVICGVSEPLHDDNIYYKVRYLTYNEEVKEFWASQSTLLSRKELKTQFLSKGINCPENNILLETVEYISRSIADFGSRLKKEFSAKQNGWNKDKTIFILGDRAITANGIETTLSVGGTKGYPELEKKGTLEEWVTGVKSMMEYDVVRFKFYDAFTAPLNAILGIESHITDNYGNTSVGKTFSAWMGLSGIGDAEGLTVGAKSSAKGILVTIRDFSDLPILIDESSDAGDHLADLVYPLTSNKGRVKSTQDGKRDGGEEYHTTTMFTGERPIRDCLQNSGQQYRVTELDDSLPDLPTREIKRVTTAIRENHGHIIELYIQEIFKRLENKSLHVLYDNCFDVLPENTSNIEGRSKAIFAGIMTAGKILENIFEKIGLPKKNAVDIVSTYYKKCIQDKPVELEYVRALRVILDWVQSDYGKFVNFTKDYISAELNDKNKRYGFVDYDYIDIIGTNFTHKMTEEKFSPAKIKEDLYKKGITVSNDEVRPGNFRTSHKGFGSFYGIRITRSIAEELVGYNLKETATKENDESRKFAQDEKIRFIIDTIRLLTKVQGFADIHLIRPILKFSELDELLNILTKNGKILQIDQNTYKAIN